RLTRMASTNLDLVRAIVLAWERGDYSSADWAYPEIELVTADGPAPASRSGLAGMAEGEREFLNAWEDYRLVADEYRELDGEHTLVIVRHSGRGKASGLDLGEMGEKGAVLFRIRDGKVR